MSLQAVAHASPFQWMPATRPGKTISLRGNHLNATERLAIAKDEGEEQQIFEVALPASSW
jgi:hypothetical protein